MSGLKNLLLAASAATLTVPTVPAVAQNVSSQVPSNDPFTPDTRPYSLKRIIMTLPNGTTYELANRQSMFMQANNPAHPSHPRNQALGVIMQEIDARLPNLDKASYDEILGRIVTGTNELGRGMEARFDIYVREKNSTQTVALHYNVARATNGALVAQEQGVVHSSPAQTASGTGQRIPSGTPVSADSGLIETMTDTLFKAYKKDRDPKAPEALRGNIRNVTIAGLTGKINTYGAQSLRFPFNTATGETLCAMTAPVTVTPRQDQNGATVAWVSLSAAPQAACKPQ